MRANWLSVLFLFIALGCVYGQTSAPDKGTTSAKSGPDFWRQVEKDTFLIVNQYRVKNDLPALEWSDGITKIARAHSKDMATGDADFGHEGFNDRVHQLKDLMPGFHGAGENVLMSDQLDDIAHAAVQLWLHSPLHLKNIRGDFNYSGMGVWQSGDGTLYFTQIFLKTVPPQPQTTDATPEVQSSFGFLAAPFTRPQR
jgi:uncharacterized protein YkwD